MKLDSVEEVFFIVVFTLFGIQTIAAGVGWLFKHWRKFTEMEEAWDEPEDSPQENP